MSTNNWTSTGEPKKASGKWHSTKGSVKESLGSAMGIHSMQRSGREEHAAGEAEYNAARAKGYVEGTKDRAVGYKDPVAGAVMGDRTQQAHGNAQKEHGATQQNWNK